MSSALRRTLSASLRPRIPLPASSFDDPERLFASVPTRSLAVALANLYLLAWGPAVDVGSAAVRRVMEAGDGMVRRVVVNGLRSTVYGHFCAGETAEEAAGTLREMWGRGLRGILDYGLEDADGDEECDRNLEEFLRTVGMTPHLPPKSVSFACVKLTALCPISLLEKVSLHLRHHHSDHQHLPWLHPSLPVLPYTAPISHLPPPPPLSTSDHDRLNLALDRLSTLCSACQDLDLPLLVDAEYSSVQPAIDHLTYAAMLRFNQHCNGTGRPLVYGTVQAYLRDSMDRLATVVGEAERRGVPVGFKLVRGAYISRERREAAERGVESPVHRTIEDTHESYDRCAAFLLEKVASGSAAAVLATHNVVSGTCTILELFFSELDQIGSDYVFKEEGRGQGGRAWDGQERCESGVCATQGHGRISFPRVEQCRVQC